MESVESQRQAKTPMARNFARRARRSSTGSVPSSSAKCATTDSRSSWAAAVGVLLSAAGGLRDDPLDHAEVEAVAGVEAERRRRLLRLRGVTPEDRRAALGRDDRVDRVLLHQHPVRDRDRDGAAGAALADHDRDGRHAEPRHHGLGTGDRAALTVLLGGDARVGTGGVDEREEREAVPVGELHHAHRLAVALRDTPCRSSASCAPSGRVPSGGR